MSSEQQSKYAEAGVDIDKGNEFIKRIKPMVSATHKRGVLTDIGGFGALFALGGFNYKDPVLVSSTDGVGTKLNVAKLCGRHDTVGIDLVAMCVNDIVVNGGLPLFFLDYFAVGELDLDVASEVIKGIAKGCEISGCSLIGGETAEMPGLYRPGDYDLAGFVVGIVERDRIIDGSDIKVGDKLLGLASSGLHSNGFSLVRKICFDDLGLSVDDMIPELGCTLGEELIKPTRIYVPAIRNVVKNFPIQGIIHITGGGFFDNIPRILPHGCGVKIEAGTWPVPPIFKFLKEKGGVSPEEMCRTFNCGIGMVLVVSPEVVEDLSFQLAALGEHPYVIGEVVAGGSEGSEVELDCAASFR